MSETSGREGVSANELIGFMNGDTLRQFQDLVGRTETSVEDLVKLARIISDSGRQRLAEALRDVLAQTPELAESPAIKVIEASTRPRHRHMSLLDACIEADVPAYIYGEAGSGKSTAAENAAAVRGVRLRAASLSPQTSKSDLLGYRDAGGVYHPSGFREIWEEGGLYLFDEIDNGNPSSTAIMNRALAGWENEFPDGPVERNWNTRVMAAANTIGKGATGLYVGRNPIDAATLDRFAMIPWDIDEKLEEKLMKLDDDEPNYSNDVDISEGGIPTRREWLNAVKDHRRRAQENGLRVVISPRSSIYGAKLAEQGVGVKWLTEMLIYKGISETDRRKLRVF